MNQKDNKKEKENPTIQIEKPEVQSREKPADQKKSRITAIVPLRGHTDESIDYNVTLIRKCIESLKESRFIQQIVISADDERLFDIVHQYTEFESVLRPKELSAPGVRVHQVLQYTIEQLAEKGIDPDLLVPVEITYPFRPKGLFDELIQMYLDHDYNTVIAGVPELRVCWKEGQDGFESVTDISIDRQQRQPLYIGLPSLGCVIDPDLVKQGKRYGEKLGIYQVDEPFATVEIRTPQQLRHIARQLYWPVEE